MRLAWSEGPLALATPVKAISMGVEGYTKTILVYLVWRWLRELGSEMESYLILPRCDIVYINLV